MENQALPLDGEGMITATAAEDGAPDDTGILPQKGETAVGAETGDEPSPEEADEGRDTATDFSALATEDLAALQAAFPALSGMASLAELADPVRYGELREAGLSPIEAFCASHHQMLTTRHTDSRRHLSPSIGRAASAPGGRISAAALSDARELFPSLSDREIEALYRRVNPTR